MTATKKLVLLLVTLCLMVPTPAAAADNPCAGVSGPCFWVAKLTQPRDGGTVVEIRGRGFAPDAAIELQKKVFGIWVTIPWVDHNGDTTTRDNGTFKFDMGGSFVTDGDYRLDTAPASSEDAFLRVIDVTCPARPRPCSVEQVVP